MHENCKTVNKQNWYIAVVTGYHIVSCHPIITQAISNRRLAYQFFLEFNVSIMCRSRESLFGN